MIFSSSSSETHRCFQQSRTEIERRKEIQVIGRVRSLYDFPVAKGTVDMSGKKGEGPMKIG